MRVLAVGGTGMVGRSLAEVFAQAGHEVVPTGLRARSAPPGTDRALRLDARSYQAVDAVVGRAAPDLVIDLVAETSSERCQADPEHALLTNAVTARNVALACRKAGVPMVFVSSACVFDGARDEHSPYTEADEPRPAGEYGATKHRGEEWVRETLDHHYVVRSSWMVGGGPYDHRFVGRILDLLEGGATRIRAVADRFGTPTYAADFARCLLGLVESGRYGTYHMAGHGFASRYDLARHIVDTLRLPGVSVEPVPAEVFEGPDASWRPRSEVLDNGRLREHGLDVMRPWRVALSEYLSEPSATGGVKGTR